MDSSFCTTWSGLEGLAMVLQVPFGFLVYGRHIFEIRSMGFGIYCRIEEMQESTEKSKTCDKSSQILLKLVEERFRCAAFKLATIDV
jgi:hypothetical protein